MNILISISKYVKVWVAGRCRRGGRALLEDAVAIERGVGRSLRKSEKSENRNPLSELTMRHRFRQAHPAAPPEVRKKSLLEGRVDIKDEVAELKRRRILDAAIELFDESGFSQTTVDAIAKKLGVTKPFVYSYFENKTKILIEICLISLTQSKAAIDCAVADCDAPCDQLRAAVEGLSLAVIDNQKSVNIFDREEKYHDEETRQIVLEYQSYLTKMLTRIIADGNRRGDFTCDDTQSAVFAIGGMVSWIRRWYSPAGKLGRQEVARAQGRVALRIVGAPTLD